MFVFLFLEIIIWFVFLYVLVILSSVELNIFYTSGQL